MPYYEEVLTKVQEGDAEKSEIYARAYLARGRARLEIGQKAHAIVDFEQSAKIWRELEDNYNASRAVWAKIKETGGLKPGTIALLEKDRFRYGWRPIGCMRLAFRAVPGRRSHTARSLPRLVGIS